MPPAVSKRRHRGVVKRNALRADRRQETRRDNGRNVSVLGREQERQQDNWPARLVKKAIGARMTRIGPAKSGF